MNIRINLDNLEQGVKDLERLISKLEYFTADVAEEARMGVGYNDVSVHHNGSGSHTIIASGNQIAFEEFGAGYVADYESGFHEWGGEDFHTEPGVWSETHERTFQNHMESGKPPSTYRYNRIPQNRMQRTAQRLHSDTAQKASEYFK